MVGNRHLELKEELIEQDVQRGWRVELSDALKLHENGMDLRAIRDERKRSESVCKQLL